MKTYAQLSKNICGKCKEHCCTYELDNNIQNIFLKKNDAIKHQLIEKRNAEETCLAYHDKSCLAYEYRPAVCRKHYCEKWEDVDKKIVINGNIRESGIEKLAKKIRFIANNMELDYLIFSKNPVKDSKVITELIPIKIAIDDEMSLTALENFDKLKDYNIIITNTSTEDFLKDVDFLNGKILQETTLDGTLLMNKWFYTKNEVLCRDLVKVL